MKKSSLSYKTRKPGLWALAFLFSILSVSAQDITGNWKGALSIQGMKLHLVFHITKNDSGYTATMDSPDQGATGIPMTSATYENGTLTLVMKMAGIEYTAKADSAGNFTGNFKQSGMTLPLTISKNASPEVKPKRPQEPKTPYPYHSEDVTFQNKGAGITLAGTFTWPEGKGEFPAVVLITGSGPQNRNEELMGHKPFLVLSDYLTRNGIAVLRYDDRGCFQSKGNFQTATTADFATDADAAVKYLLTRKEVNPKEIGLIGHSEGGIVAPMVAVKDPKVSYIVLMAGTGVPGYKIMIKQQAMIGRTNGMSEKDIETATNLNKHIFGIIEKTADIDSLHHQLKKYLVETYKNNPDMKIPKGQDINTIIEGQLKQILSPWMLYFLRHDPAPVLKKVKCPVLAIDGSKDLQVDATINLKAIETALNAGGNKNFETKELPGLNHLFQECKTGSPKEYSQIEQTISPMALKTIGDWIKSMNQINHN